jgi:hypothetical protein
MQDRDVEPPAMAAWNLAVRFLLEIAAFAGFAGLAWDRTSGAVRWIGAILAPLLVATAWGTFAVADDPSRSGSAPVAVPGRVRLLLELVVLLGGAAAVGSTWGRWWGLGMAAAVLAHYAVSGPRNRWLIRQ